MSPTLANFFVETVNFLCLAGGLGWLLFKPVRRALEAEQARHEARAAESETLRVEAERLVAAADAKHAATERETVAARAEVLARARDEAASLLAEARKRLGEERSAFEDELRARRDADAAALAEMLGRIAAESVSRVLERAGGPSLDVVLVRAACEELQSLPGDARARAVVESAHPLPDEARSMLQRALGSEFQERTVDALRAGVRVTTSHGQVDATISSLAREAERAVRRTALGEGERADERTRADH